MKLPITTFLLVLIIAMTCCSSDATNDKEIEEIENTETTEGLAQITKITVSGQDNQYTFNVTITSPDLGCNQYANWWEVIDLDGNLLYRRVLAHSHVNEQPFTRSGSAVSISETTEVYVRAHMNTTSYGNMVFKGSVADGFTAANLDSKFAKELQEVAPLPTGCAF